MSEDPIVLLASARSDREIAGRPHLWPIILFVLVLMSIAVGVFGTKPSPDATVEPSTTPERILRTYTVSYRFGVFSPTNLRIHVGDTVHFRNDSPLAIRVTSQLQAGQKTPEFDSNGDIQSGDFFAYTFSRQGVYPYYNNSDPNETGVIIVRE